MAPAPASTDAGSSQAGSTSSGSPALSTSANRHRSNIASTVAGGKSSVVDIPHLPPGLPSSYQYNFDYITKGASALGGNGGRDRARVSMSSGAVRSGTTSSASLRSKRRASSVSLTSRSSLAAPPPVALRRDVGHHSGRGMVGWQSSHQDRNNFGSQYGMTLPRKMATTSTETINAYEQNLRRRSMSFTYHQCYSSPSLATLPGLSPETDTDPERESLSSVSSLSSYSSGNSEYDSPPTSGTPSPASSPPDKSNPLVDIESSKLFQEFSSPARRAALEREFEEERRRREAEHTRLLRWRYVAGILLSRSSGKPITRKLGATIPNAPQGLGLEIDAADEAHAVRIRKGYVKSSLSTVVVLEVQ